MLKMVGWGLRALSAQIGYIVPFMPKKHSTGAENGNDNNSIIILQKRRTIVVAGKSLQFLSDQS